MTGMPEDIAPACVGTLNSFGRLSIYRQNVLALLPCLYCCRFFGERRDLLVS